MIEGIMGVVLEVFSEADLKVGSFCLEFVFSRSKLRKFKFVFLRKKIVGDFLEIEIVMEGTFFFRVFYLFGFDDMDGNIDFFLLGGVRI